MSLTGIQNPETWYTVCKGSVPGCLRVRAHQNQTEATNHALSLWNQYKIEKTGLRTRSLTGRIIIGKGLYRSYPNQQWNIHTEIDSVDSFTFSRGGVSDSSITATEPNGDKSTHGLCYGEYPEDDCISFSLSLDFGGSNLSPIISLSCLKQGEPATIPDGFLFGVYIQTPTGRIPDYGYLPNPTGQTTIQLENTDLLNGATVYADILGIDRIDNDLFDIESLYSEYVRGKYHDIDSREIFATVQYTVEPLTASIGFGWWRRTGQDSSGNRLFAVSATMENPSGVYQWKPENPENARHHAYIDLVRAEVWIYSVGSDIPEIRSLEYPWFSGGGRDGLQSWVSWDVNTQQVSPFPKSWERVETKIYTRYVLGKPIQTLDGWEFPTMHEVVSTNPFLLSGGETQEEREIEVSDSGRVKPRRGFPIPGLPLSNLVIEFGGLNVKVYIETIGDGMNPFGGEDTTKFGVSAGLKFTPDGFTAGLSPIASIWGFDPYKIGNGVSGGVSGIRSAITKGDYRGLGKAIDNLNNAVEQVINGMVSNSTNRGSTVGRVDR